MENDCRIEFADSAEKAYLKLFEEAQACLDAGQKSDKKVSLFKSVDELIFTTIFQNPFNADWALPGNLSKFYRVIQANACVVYVGLIEYRQITVLYTGQKIRLDCHPHDPYSDLMRMIRDGNADQFLKIIGVTPPIPIMSPSRSELYRGQ